MIEPLPCVVLADPPLAALTTRRLLDRQFRIVEAHHYSAALEAVQREAPDVLIVGYHFDGLRPYRLIQQARQDAHVGLPILMVKAFPLERGSTDDDQVRRAYQAFGVRDFISLPALLERLGEEEASRELAGIVRGLLPTIPSRSGRA